MARSLLKKEVGSEAVVKTEAGVFTWHVNSIEYENSMLFVDSLLTDVTQAFIRINDCSEFRKL